jgi:hypothetical protein
MPKFLNSFHEMFLISFLDESSIVPLSLRSDCGISLKRVPDRKPRDIER